MAVFGTAKFGTAAFGAVFTKTLTETVAVVDTKIIKASKVLSEVVSIIDAVSNTTVKAVGFILGLNKDDGIITGFRKR